MTDSQTGGRLINGPIQIHFPHKIQNNSASQKTWKLHRFQPSWDTDPKQVCYSLNNIQQVEALINWVRSPACRVRKCVFERVHTLVCICLIQQL